METARKFSEPFKVTDDKITIALENGEGNKYQVQKKLLCEASAYFVRALDGSFTEGSIASPTLKLPGCDTDTFEVFLYWLHHSKFPPQFGLEPVLRLPTVHAKRRQLTLQRRQLTVQLWSFGNAYLMPKFQNLAMKAYLESLGEQFISLEDVSLVAEMAPQGSPLWNATMDELAHDYDTLLHDAEVRMIHSANIPGVMVELIKRLRGHDGCTSLLPQPRRRNVEQFMVPEHEF